MCSKHKLGPPRRLSALNYVERLRPMLVEQLCQRMLAVQEAAAKREQEQAKPKGKSKWSKVTLRPLHRTAPP